MTPEIGGLWAGEVFRLSGSNYVITTEGDIAEAGSDKNGHAGSVAAPCPYLEKLREAGIEALRRELIVMQSDGQQSVRCNCCIECRLACDPVHAF